MFPSWFPAGSGCPASSEAMTQALCAGPLGRREQSEGRAARTSRTDAEPHVPLAVCPGMVGSWVSLQRTTGLGAGWAGGLWGPERRLLPGPYVRATGGAGEQARPPTRGRACSGEDRAWPLYQPWLLLPHWPQCACPHRGLLQPLVGPLPSQNCHQPPPSEPPSQLLWCPAVPSRGPLPSTSKRLRRHLLGAAHALRLLSNSGPHSGWERRQQGENLSHTTLRDSVLSRGLSPVHRPPIVWAPAARPADT